MDGKVESIPELTGDLSNLSAPFGLLAGKLQGKTDDQSRYTVVTRGLLDADERRPFSAPSPDGCERGSDGPRFVREGETHPHFPEVHAEGSHVRFSESHPSGEPIESGFQTRAVIEQLS